MYSAGRGAPDGGKGNRGRGRCVSAAPGPVALPGGLRPQFPPLPHNPLSALLPGASCAEPPSDSEDTRSVRTARGLRFPPRETYRRRRAAPGSWGRDLEGRAAVGPEDRAGCRRERQGSGPGARGRSLREARGTCPGGRGRGGTQVKPHLALTLQPALLEPRRHVAHVCPLQGFLGHVQRAFRPVEVDQLLHEVQGVRALQPPPRDAAAIHPLVPQFVAEALQLLLAQVFQGAQEQLAGSGSAGLHAGGGRTRSAGCRAPVTLASRPRVRPQPRAPTGRGFDAPASIQVAPGQRLKERSTGRVVLSSQDRDRGLSSKAFQGFHAADRIAVWWRNGVTPRRALAAADPSVRGRLPTPHPAFCSSLLGIHVKCPE